MGIGLGNVGGWVLPANTPQVLSPDLDTVIINSEDCLTTIHPNLLQAGTLVGREIVIRGYSSDCHIYDPYICQVRFKITSHTLSGSTPNGARLGVSYYPGTSSAVGIFNSLTKYYNIIIGSDIAPMGPTGPPGIVHYIVEGVTGPVGHTATAYYDSNTFDISVNTDVSFSLCYQNVGGIDTSSVYFLPWGGQSMNTTPLTGALAFNRCAWMKVDASWAMISPGDASTPPGGFVYIPTYWRAQ